MALKVWLPLDGTLKNYGCSDIQIDSENITVNTNGKIGSCYSFNNNNSYISLTGQTFFDIIKGGNNPFSITMWVYHSDSTRGVLFGDYSLNGAINVNIELTTGHLVRFYWNGNPDYTSALNVDLNIWSHIAITYDGSTLNFYKNGTLVNTRAGTLSTLTKTSGAYYLGRDSRTGSTTALNGNLNDFRLYNHCLSIKEIKEISQGLVLHYKLDDDTNQIIDSSGYNHTGTIVGTESLSNDSVRYNKSINLSTGASRINCGRGAMVIDALTVNIWVKCSTFSYPFSCYNSGGWRFYHSNNYLRFSLYQLGTAKNCTSTKTLTSSIANNQWHMLTGVFDRLEKSMKIYVDGELDTTYITSTTDTISYNSSNVLWIGASATASNTSANNGMIGLFNDFRVYCTPLSAEDIKELYQTAMSIDKNKNLHTFELIEDNYVDRLTHLGQLKCAMLNETNNNKCFTDKNKQWTAKQFIEK